MDLIERVSLAIAKRNYPSGSVSDHAEMAEGFTFEAKAAITEAFTIPTDPTESDRQRYQALCDALDAAGYRPTGWVEPERLK